MLACIQETFPLMRYSISPVTVLLVAALAAVGCDTNTLPETPTEPTPVQITETFSGTLTVNGGRTHPYSVTRVGATSAQLMTLSDPAATVGLSLGTWNGAACQIVIANDAAALTSTVTGTAQSVGQFCVRLYDVGKLTAPVDYSVDVVHY